MTEYRALLELFSDHLTRHISSLNERKPSELYAPEAYILSLGGKRLRPLLALIACDLYEKDPALALDAALAVELFHNFSLIHDDILDAAPLRRNQATVHTKWNSNIAILSGDVVLVKAFQELLKYDVRVSQALNTLFTRTAIEVCEGQQLDMNFESLSSVSVDEYIHMITNKTAVLLGCSLEMGGIIAGTSENDRKHLYAFGKHLGISFQLLDDLLDAFATDPEKFGKQVGGDILANKKTFLLLKAMELADPGRMSEIEHIISLINKEEKVKSMLEIFEALHVKELCRAEADKHTQLALEHLDKLSAPAARKETLKQFARDLLSREL